MRVSIKRTFGYRLTEDWCKQNGNPTIIREGEKDFVDIDDIESLFALAKQVKSEIIVDALGVLEVYDDFRE